jgi:hypothetical protein
VRTDAFENFSMQNIQLDERPPPAAHLLHARVIFLAPGIRECKPVEIMTHWLENALRFARNATAPIHERAERVENQRLDVGHRQPGCGLRARAPWHEGRVTGEHTGGHQCGPAANETAASRIHNGILR